MEEKEGGFPREPKGPVNSRYCLVNWRLMENVNFDGAPFLPQIVNFFNKGETYISYGSEMQRRAKELNANLGEGHAQYLLENQKLIPKSWRKYLLNFPGTIWGRPIRIDIPGNERVIPILYWHKTEWEMDFFNYADGKRNDGKYRNDRLIRMRR